MQSAARRAAANLGNALCVLVQTRVRAGAPTGDNLSGMALPPLDLVKCVRETARSPVTLLRRPGLDGGAMRLKSNAFIELETDDAVVCIERFVRELRQL